MEKTPCPDCPWSKKECIHSMFDACGVPRDPRWRSLLLYFRSIAEYPHLTDAQKNKAQTLMAETFSQRDFTDKRLSYVLKEYYGGITASHRVALEALAREVADLTRHFKDLLSKRRGDLGALEDTAVGIVEGFTDDQGAILRLHDAFWQLRSVMERDILSLDDLAYKDALTGLANRRGFTAFMDRAVAAWQEKQTPLAMAMFDIDHFKQFNDTHGHRIGDQVLIVVSKHIQRIIEKYQSRDNRVISVRYGGEEFVVAVSGDEAAQIRDMAEEIRHAIRGYNFLIRDVEGQVVERGVRITVSVGVAPAWSGWKGGAVLDNLVDCADKAMYFAKDKGRDCCVMFAPTDTRGFVMVSDAAHKA